jgi:hypothetical protein
LNVPVSARYCWRKRSAAAGGERTGQRHDDPSPLEGELWIHPEAHRAANGHHFAEVTLHDERPTVDKTTVPVETVRLITETSAWSAQEEHPGSSGRDDARPARHEAPAGVSFPA